MFALKIISKVPFKVYADFECSLKTAESYEGTYSNKYQDSVPCSFAYKLVCVNDESTKPLVFFRGENAAYEFIKAIHEEFEYCKKVMKKHVNKNLLMREEEEEQFQSSKTCWNCEKLIDYYDKKVRDHCHVTGKFRGAAQWSCNMALVFILTVCNL